MNRFPVRVESTSINSPLSVLIYIRYLRKFSLLLCVQRGVKLFAPKPSLTSSKVTASGAGISTAEELNTTDSSSSTEAVTSYSPNLSPSVSITLACPSEFVVTEFALSPQLIAASGSLVTAKFTDIPSTGVSFSSTTCTISG